MIIVMNDTLKKSIEADINNNQVFVYMKGTPEFPQCGFSSNTVNIFKHLGVAFKTRDVLAEPELRKGIKEFSNWPTIPQVFINGEFVGGNDITTELYQSGELAKMLGK